MIAASTAEPFCFKILADNSEHTGASAAIAANMVRKQQLDESILKDKHSQS